MRSAIQYPPSFAPIAEEEMIYLSGGDAPSASADDSGGFLAAAVIGIASVYTVVWTSAFVTSTKMLIDFYNNYRKTYGIDGAVPDTLDTDIQNYIMRSIHHTSSSDLIKQFFPILLANALHIPMKFYSLPAIKIANQYIKHH